MRSSVEIGKVFGIPIRIHFTFFLLLIFIALTGINEGIEGLFRVILVCWVFICVVLHELGHSLMARYFGIKVDSITLLPIGGVAAMRTVPTRPAAEFLISAAGPAVSVFLSILFGILSSRLYGRDIWSYYSEYNFDAPIIVQLSIINLALAIFNLIPAFPMDGGRLVRAILWYKYGFLKATAFAASIGKFLAVVMLIAALLMGKFLLAIIALFIYLGAQTEASSAYWVEKLNQLKAADALQPDIISILPKQAIKDIYELGRYRNQFNFPIIDEYNRLIGILTKDSLLSAMKNGKHYEPAENFMKKKIYFCYPEDRLSDVVEDIVQNNLPYVLVIDADNHVYGMITPEEVQRKIYSSTKDI